MMPFGLITKTMDASDRNAEPGRQHFVGRTGKTRGQTKGKYGSVDS